MASSPSSSSRSRARLLAVVSLLALTIQNATLALVLHASRTGTTTIGKDGQNLPRYYAPSAVLLTETAKATISAALVLHEIGTLSIASLRHLKQLTFSRSALPLALPAILYVLQNNLQYTAAENLEPAVFQTLYQLKILTTALCARLLLGTRLSQKQWGALVILAIGVAIVQVGDSSSRSAAADSQPPPPPPSSSSSSLPSPQAHHHAASHETGSSMTGFLAVLCACFTSGLAGVWFEKVLKRSGGRDATPVQNHQQQQRQHEAFQPGEVIFSEDSTKDRSDYDEEASAEEDQAHHRSVHRVPRLFGRSSPPAYSVSRHASTRESSPHQSENIDLWVRNLQLSMFSLVPALVPVIARSFKRAQPLASEGDAIVIEWDPSAPWRHFGVWAWTIVALQTFGGLVTACVMRWADNILKCFAVALALLVTSLLSIPLFDFELTPSFVLGASLTLVATALYQQRATAPPPAAVISSEVSDGQGADALKARLSRAEDDRADNGEETERHAMLGSRMARDSVPMQRVSSEVRPIR